MKAAHRLLLRDAVTLPLLLGGMAYAFIDPSLVNTFVGDQGGSMVVRRNEM